MIHFHNITIEVQQQTLLKNIDLAVAGGDKVVICGASGTGKSSLLRCAVGGLATTTGTVNIDGIELSAATVSDIRQRISFIGQEPVLGAEYVRDALLLPFTFKAHKDKRPTEEEIIQTLERLRLTADILNKPCNRISGGEKQRIAVVRTLLLHKNIFLVDEITSALDRESKRAVIATLFQAENTILSVSHDPDWINACDRVVEIKDLQLHESKRGKKP